MVSEKSEANRLGSSNTANNVPDCLNRHQRFQREAKSSVLLHTTKIISALKDKMPGHFTSEDNDRTMGGA